MNATMFLATTGQGLARARRTSGGGWSVERLLTGLDVRCLSSDPANPARLYAGTQGSGVMRSTDSGTTWQAAGMPGRIVKSLAVSPHQPGTIYAGTRPAALFVTRDDGASWTELDGFQRVRRWYWRSPAELPLQPYVLGLAVSPADPAVIVAGIEAGAVVRSTDGGQSWAGHCRGADRDCHFLTFHSTQGRWVYMAGGGGPALSQDAGQTWRKLRDGLDGRYCMACAADPERPEVWYAATSPGFSLRHFAPRAHVDGDACASIYRCAGGARWEKLGGGLPQPLSYMAYALLTDRSAPGHLYAGLANGDVWHSADYGDSWQRLPFNLGRIQYSLLMLGAASPAPPGP